MKNLMTASACVVLLMAFLVQFVHQQVLFQRLVLVNQAMDVYLEREDEGWLQEEVSRLMACSRDEVEITAGRDQLLVRFPIDCVASPSFWGIDDEMNCRQYVLERVITEKGEA